MEIDRKQIKYKKEIGKLGKDPVLEIGTIGGLFLVVLNKNGKIETLGVGPHRAVARHISRKRNPTMVMTELSKSDDLAEDVYSHMVEAYEKVTDKFNA